MVIDAASGAVHSVDEVAYDAIEKLDAAICDAEGGANAVFSDKELMDSIASEIVQKHGITAEEADETLEDIAELHENRLLWSEDPFEQAADEIKINSQSSKRSASTWHTAATWTANTALQARATTAARAAS